MLLKASQFDEQAALVLILDREFLMLAKLPQVLRNSNQRAVLRGLDASCVLYAQSDRLKSPERGLPQRESLTLLLADHDEAGNQAGQDTPCCRKAKCYYSCLGH